MGSIKTKTKTKTKTFTGCWTCRSRKVKCDTTRPICRRCARAGLSCQGYDVRLHWVEDDDPVAPSAIKRQAMGLTLGNPHWPAKLDVDERLHDLDRCEQGPSLETRLFGPFGVFCSLPYPSTDDEDSVPKMGDKTLWASPTGATADPDVVHNVDLAGLDVEPSLDKLALVPSMSTGHYEQTQDELLDEDDEVEYVFRSPEHRLEPKGVGGQHLIARSDLGRAMSRQNMISTLMDHYVQNVANILQPIRHPRNTYSSIYATTAMTVAQRMPWDDSACNFKISNSEVALLYSLLASAAFKLRGYDEDSETDHCARSFRTKAISHLQLALKSLTGPGQTSARMKREEILSVMLTLITADVLDGQMTEVWIHLNGAEQIARSLADQVVPGSRGEQLLNVCLFQRVIAQSTNVDTKPAPWVEDPDVYSQPRLFHGDGQGLEFTYGVTATLVDFIRRTTALARYVAYYEPTGAALPAGLRSACHRLLTDISSWDISQEKLSSLANLDGTTVLLASKHVLAFAYSIRIYFHTRVLPCNPSELASYVSLVAAHLSDIESIKKRTGYDAVLTATIVWPGFIASCEAGSRERAAWNEWWGRMLQYRIGNIKTLWHVVQKTWIRNDQGDDQRPSWMPVLQESHKRILVL